MVGGSVGIIRSYYCLAMKNLDKVTRTVLTLSFVLLGACTNQQASELKNARKSAQSGDFRIALSLYEGIIKKNNEDEYTTIAAREAAKIAFFEVKNYQKALSFYRLLVLKSPDLNERVEAQRKIVEVYFEHFQDYPRAVQEISSILQLPSVDLPEKQRLRMSLAKAYYYQNDFKQSQSEIAQLLKTNPPAEIRFNAELLNANILIGKKEYSAASQLLTEMIEEMPNKAQDENLPLLLAVTLEENGQYDRAVKILRDYRDKYKTPEYIDLRINHILERQKNAPGARGFRK